jgi:hypothetical protein
MRFGPKLQVELSGGLYEKDGVNVCLLQGRRLASDATEFKNRNFERLG